MSKLANLLYATNILYKIPCEKSTTAFPRLLTISLKSDQTTGNEKHVVGNAAFLV
jgi:hypothetical protein